MSLINWLVKKSLNKKIGAKSESNSKRLDELLKLSTEDYTKVLRDAKKINSANEVILRTRQLKEELKEGLSEDYEEEEEEESDGADKMLMTLANKFLMGSSGSEGNSDIMNKVSEVAGALTKEQKKGLVDRFLK